MTAEPMAIPAIAGGWRVSGHARGVMTERAFRLDDVLAACEDPQQTYTSFCYGPDRWIYQRGHIAVVLNPVSRTIITVLLRSASEWDDDDARRTNARIGPPAA